MSISPFKSSLKTNECLSASENEVAKVQDAKENVSENEAAVAPVSMTNVPGPEMVDSVT
jgi:hypothetical protein